MDMNDPGDEDDGAAKLEMAHLKAWIKARRAWAQPMVAPKGMLFRMHLEYGSTPVYDHDGGDEDRRDARPEWRPLRQPCTRRQDYTKRGIR